jgi:hypothetical protein
MLAACAVRPATPPATTATTSAATTTTTTTTRAVSAEELVDHSGDSTTTAIAVPADAPNGGVDFQNNWIYDRYGRFRRAGGGTGSLDGRRYNVVEIELPSGEKKKVFFDITELWAKWNPPSQ